MPSAETTKFTCLSLPRRTDRRFVFERAFPAFLQSPVEFFPAVDGEIVPAWKVQRLREKHGLQHLSGANLAVRISKRLILREFLKTEAECLLLMEDDCLFLPEFEEDWQMATRELPDHWDVCFFGVGKAAAAGRSGPAGRLRRLCSIGGESHCVLFSREGARNCLRLLSALSAADGTCEIHYALSHRLLAGYWTGRSSVVQRAGISNQNADREDFPCCALMMAGQDDAYLLAAAVEAGDTVLEWGSGGSTYLLAKAVGPAGRVFSIEQQESHSEGTQRLLAREPELTGRVKLHVVPPIPNRPQDSPWRYLPAQLDAYVQAPLKFLRPGEVDVAFVDGRERMRCVDVALRLLRPGGYLLIHDFWGRARYREEIGKILRRAELAATSPSGYKEGKTTDMVVFRTH